MAASSESDKVFRGIGPEGLVLDFKVESAKPFGDERGEVRDIIKPLPFNIGEAIARLRGKP